MSWVERIFRRRKRLASPGASAPRAAATAARGRPFAFESMERRQLLATVPLVVGAVYHEMDAGADLHGDTIAIKFEGGVPGTQLTHLVINGDQNAPGLSVGDMIFDTVKGGLGADEAAPFTIVSKQGIDNVTWHVEDGSSKLVLDLVGFDPGETLEISIDVDEVQQYDPAQTDLAKVNEGIDPIASGVEFQGSHLEATFQAPDYFDTSGSSEFRNAYDPLFDGTNLLRSDANPAGLPRDNDDGLRDRSTGTALPLAQTPRPASLCGVVYDDLDHDGIRDASEPGIGNVRLQVLPVSTVANQEVVQLVTAADGTFCAQNLMPGTYRLVETQPSEFLDGLDTPGTVAGETRGVAQNPGDEIKQIQLHGGDAAVNYWFGENHPSQLAGWVYHDRDRDGVRDPNEEPIGQVAIQLLDGAGHVVAQTATAADGSYHFERLPAGVYQIVETQPSGWQDGLDTPGRIGGQVVGQAHNPGDLIDQVLLDWGQTATDYNFGEWKFASLAGSVRSSTTDDCATDADSRPLGGIELELVSSAGQVIATTTTAASGAYRFDNLVPGAYTVRERQPAGLFTAGQHAGSAGGDATVANVIANIVLGSGQAAIDYRFCEAPPATISGRVFRDGSALFTEDGQLPPDWQSQRDGRFTADDLPLAGVWVELRDGTTGAPLSADDVLPGFNPADLRVQTDSAGRFEFQGLRGGRVYALYEVQPDDYVDGLDTPGSTGGYAFNAGADPPTDVSGPLVRDPQHDALVRIPVTPGETSSENWFSELEVIKKPRPIPPIYPPIEFVQQPFVPPPTAPLAPAPLTPPPAPNVVAVTIPTVDKGFTTSQSGMTWHLSVVDAGQPRGVARLNPLDSLAWRSISQLGRWKWNTRRLSEAQWTVSVELPDPASHDEYRQFLFGLPDAVPVAGDFNGDGQSEFGIFYRGEWFIDVNANGQWDQADLWAQLGSPGDLPVVGDWDGDGKDDIGIFGPEWRGDMQALAHESGLPDLQNSDTRHAKNLPPQAGEATNGGRLLKLSEQGQPRADLIDHVLRFGAEGDSPVAGDWDGDGISTIGVFRDGRWTLDTDGDGALGDNDLRVEFGDPADEPVVGDFNGDGIDEIGVYRRGRWILDSNNNHRLDPDDRQFDLGTAQDRPVVGDFDGDGRDEPGLFGQPQASETHQARLPTPAPE